MTAAKCPSCRHNEADHDDGQCWAEDDLFDFYAQRCTCAYYPHGSDVDVHEQLRNTGGIA